MATLVKDSPAPTLSVSQFLSLMLLFCCFVLILFSAFRGDVGSDSVTYRQFYEAIKPGEYLEDFFLLKLNLHYRFEPFFLLFFDLFSLVEADFFVVQYAVAFVSLFGLLLFFFKARTVNFIIFSLLYLSFIQWQLQWSVMRQCLAFWIITYGVTLFRRNPFLFFAPGFHYSAILAVFIKFPRCFVFLIPVGIFFIIGMVARYSQLNTDAFSSYFFGGWLRFLFGMFGFSMMAYLLRFDKLIHGSSGSSGSALSALPALSALLFSASLFITLIFPLGWRLLAVTLPFVIFIDFSGIGKRRLFLFYLFCFILIVYKGISHANNMLEAGMTPELVFIFECIFDFVYNIF
ncbi:EpsG family protein [Stutzerimonas chloritidismutans]|uniref:EpsG family protein n=1 Tax=Stutzerimonas chloritidismutans TaxID=203192 RepID=UPI0030E04A99